mmetsp:Transcript_40703/g.161355  ORF Transcript_40703/g.161355 Transcript_40703/m.161355 type:complete len:131 (-) Transcript_40703:1675-2067(-)
MRSASSHSSGLTALVLEIFACANQDLRVIDRTLVWNLDLLDALTLENLLINAVQTMHSAHNRTESRGAHSRDDFPERDDKNWMKHTISWVSRYNERLDNDRTVKIAYRPVNSQTLDPKEMETVPPGKRVY